MSGHATHAPRVEVEFMPVCMPEYAAVVSLHGALDLDTAPEVAIALAMVVGNLLVDLSGCSFIGSTVIGLLIRKSRDLEPAGYRIELVVAPDSPVAHALELLEIQKCLTVHDEPPSSEPREGFVLRVLPDP
jgi:anti-anti-sigma factor